MQLITQEALRDALITVFGHRISTPIIKRLLVQGMPCTQVGARRLFDEAKVLTWLDGQCNPIKAYRGR